MNKYDMGLVRIEKLESCKTRLKELNEYVEQIDKEMGKLGGTFSIKAMQDLLDRIIKSFAEVEFLDKESYCSFINEIKEKFDIVLVSSLEIMYNGEFSYYLTSDSTNEVVIDTPEKCWDYLKENYDAIED